MKNSRSSWVTFAVNALNINRQIVAIANGCPDIGTVVRHYLAAPNTFQAFNNIASGIAKLGDGS